MATNEQAKPATKAAAKPAAPAHSGKHFALVRVRGAPKMSTEAEDTLRLLGLNKRHSCKIVPENPTYRGMIRKIEPYIAWGEANAETIKLIGKGRGLKSPKKGFMRKGIKIPNKAGGSLGKWQDINKLIARMV